MFEWLYQSISHIKHLDDCLREAYDIHGHSHGVGKCKDETDRASELRPQAPGDQVVSSSWIARIHSINYCFTTYYWFAFGIEFISQEHRVEGL